MIKVRVIYSSKPTNAWAVKNNNKIFKIEYIIKIKIIKINKIFFPRKNIIQRGICDPPSRGVPCTPVAGGDARPGLRLLLRGARPGPKAPTGVRTTGPRPPQVIRPSDPPDRRLRKRCIGPPAYALRRGCSCLNAADPRPCRICTGNRDPPLFLPRRTFLLTIQPKFLPVTGISHYSFIFLQSTLYKSAYNLEYIL